MRHRKTGIDKENGVSTPDNRVTVHHFRRIGSNGHSLLCKGNVEDEKGNWIVPSCFYK